MPFTSGAEGPFLRILSLDERTVVEQIIHSLLVMASVRAHDISHDISHVLINWNVRWSSKFNPTVVAFSRRSGDRSVVIATIEQEQGKSSSFEAALFRYTVLEAISLDQGWISGHGVYSHSIGSKFVQGNVLWRA